MTQVELVYWNPRRPVLKSRVGRRFPMRRPVNNFGDLLGPFIVDRMLARHGLSNRGPRRTSRSRLLTVGSVLHMASKGDTVWGTGVHGAFLGMNYPAGLDIRAVRGPMTRDFLRTRGIEAPAVYGDPALLLPELLPELSRWASEPKRFELTIVPHFRESDSAYGVDVLDPRAGLLYCLERIARSKLVVSSSLHGIIVAEAAGVPARLFHPTHQPLFKYEDYYAGTGRTVDAASTASEAIMLGESEPPKWEREPLLAAFPCDLWEP
jgi:pyruvyltransferase